MSKKINIEKNIMSQIKKGELTIRPKIYFIIGSIFTFAGLVTSIVISVFFTSLIRFILKTHGPMGSYRFSQLLASFPWWALFVVGAGFIAGIYFLRKYDFSYKRNSWLVLLGFIFAVVIAGFILDATGLDNLWFRQGPMKGILKLRQGNGWKIKK